MRERSSFFNYERLTPRRQSGKCAREYTVFRKVIFFRHREREREKKGLGVVCKKGLSLSHSRQIKAGRKFAEKYISNAKFEPIYRSASKGLYTAAS